MGMVSLTEAFRRYGATNGLRTRSAMASDGSLVMKCESTRLRRAAPGVMRYEGSALGNSMAETKLLREHLQAAHNQSLQVRLIVATRLPQRVDASGAIAQQESTTFHVREDLVGKVTEFAADNVVIEFSRIGPRTESARPERKAGRARQR